MVWNDEIVDNAAENSSIGTVWFVYVIEVKCVDHSSNNIGDYGHSVPKSQPYLLCNYLEKLNDNKKGVLYQRSKKKMFSFTKKIFCIQLLSLNQIKTKKKIYFFLVAINLLKF